MGISVVANLMTFIDHAAQEIGVSLSVFPNNEESGGHVFLFQDVEDWGRPPRVRTVIKSQGHESRAIAIALNNIRSWGRDKFFLADVAISRVRIQIAPTVLRARNHLQDFAGPFEINLITINDS